MPATLTLMQAYLSIRSKLRGIKPTEVQPCLHQKPEKNPHTKKPSALAVLPHTFLFFPAEYDFSGQIYLIAST